MKNNFHVTLVRLPMVSPVSMINFSKGIPPLGLAYIAGALERENIDYSVVDALAEGIENLRELNEPPVLLRGADVRKIIDLIPKETKVLAFSEMFTAEWFVHCEMIKLIKKEFPSAQIILGGEHATSSWEKILKESEAVDFVVLGEGEETLIELLSHIKNENDNLTKISGLAYRFKNKCVRNDKRVRIKDIDSLFASWEKFNVEPFLKNGSGMNTINLRAMPILASRGCPYHCTFCSSPNMWGVNYFTKSPDIIVNEMKTLIEKFKIEHFDFTDLSATINKDWTRKMVQMIKDEGITATWQFGPGTRSEVLSNEMLDLMKSAGIYKITFAPESGSPRTLKKIKKNINVEKLYKSIKYACQIKMHTKCQFIMGMPDQTLGEMWESALFILKLAFVGVNDISIYSFYPYPGSELSAMLSQEIESSDYSKMANTRIFQKNVPLIQNGNHSKLTITFFTTFLMAVCYVINYSLRPVRLVRLIKSLYFKKPKHLLEMLFYLKWSSFKSKSSISKITLDQI